MEQWPPRALFPWKGPMSTWAVHFAFQFGKQGVFWIESYIFLLTPLQSAMWRSLRPVPWLSAGWEITLQEVSFQFYALSSLQPVWGLNESAEQGALGAGLGLQSLSNCKHGKSPSIPVSFLPASKWEQEWGVIPSASQNETREGALGVGVRPSQSFHLTLPPLLYSIPCIFSWLSIILLKPKKESRKHRLITKQIKWPGGICTQGKDDGILLHQRRN